MHCLLLMIWMIYLICWMMICKYDNILWIWKIKLKKILQVIYEKYNIIIIFFNHYRKQYNIMHITFPFTNLNLCSILYIFFIV